MPDTKARGVNTKLYVIIGLLGVVAVTAIFSLFLKLFPLNEWDVNGMSLSLNLFQSLLLALILLVVGREE